MNKWKLFQTFKKRPNFDCMLLNKTNESWLEFLYLMKINHKLIKMKKIILLMFLSSISINAQKINKRYI